MKDLKDIKFWLFDLDNTLYDGATKVFDQVDKKMSKFISEKLNVSIEEARKIQKNYLKHLYPNGGEIIVPTLTWSSDVASIFHNNFKQCRFTAAIRS